MDARKAAVFFALFAGCGPREPGPAPDAGQDTNPAERQESAHAAPEEAGTRHSPCERRDAWLAEIELPCRPYDRARDLADPPF